MKMLHKLNELVEKDISASFYISGSNDPNKKIEVFAKLCYNINLSNKFKTDNYDLDLLGYHEGWMDEVADCFKYNNHIILTTNINTCFICEMCLYIRKWRVGEVTNVDIISAKADIYSEFL